MTISLIHLFTFWGFLKLQGAKLGNTPITKVQVLASSAGLELTQMTMPPNVSHVLRENMAAQVRPLAVPCVPAENFRNIRLLRSVTPVVVALMR